MPVAAAPTRGLGGLYWRLWSASSASALGDGLRRVALPLLAVHLTTDPRLVALVAAAGTVPWLVFGLPIGALVDRFDRRRTMAAVDLLRTLTVALLAVAVAAGALSIALLVAVTFVLGTGEIFAATYHLNTHYLAIAGESAGGHIALATTEAMLPTERPSAVVSWSGPTDLQVWMTNPQPTCIGSECY